jgi:hypothetical protein
MHSGSDYERKGTSFTLDLENLMSRSPYGFDIKSLEKQ